MALSRQEAEQGESSVLPQPGRAQQSGAEHPSHAAHPCELPKAAPHHCSLPEVVPRAGTQALLLAWPGGPWIAQVELGLRRSSFIHPSFLHATGCSEPCTPRAAASPAQNTASPGSKSLAQLCPQIPHFSLKLIPTTLLSDIRKLCALQ